MDTLKSSQSGLYDRPIERSNDRTVITSIEHSLATIAINRPDALNALTPDIVGSIAESIESLGKSDDIRAIAIIGRGKAFSAGCDVVSLYTSGEREIAEFMDRGRACIAAIESCPRPVIAGVEGWCLGGGFEILLACDFVFASEDAVFGFPEIKLGLIPGFGGTQLATKRLGAARAKELIMIGRRIDAQAAFEWGLINRVVSDGGLIDEIKDFAHNLCKYSPNAISAAKRAINNSLEKGLEFGLSAEREGFMTCFEDSNTRQNLVQFFEHSKKAK